MCVEREEGRGRKRGGREREGGRETVCAELVGFTHWHGTLCVLRSKDNLQESDSYHVA